VSTTALTTTLAVPAKRVRLAAEQRIRGSALKWTILRPTMIYGAPGDRNLSRLLTVLRHAPLLPVPGGGRHLQQPVHVADVADAVLNAAQRPAAAGMTYDVAGPRPLTLAELLRTSAQAIASRTRFVPVPLTPLVTMARGYERLSQHPRIRAEQLLRLAEDKAFAIDSAARDLGFDPRPFATGIRAEAQAMGLAPPGPAQGPPHGPPQ
jgi:nucleoside-diphosphate-sugar epimerase